MTNGKYSFDELNSFLFSLKIRDIKPDHLVDGEYGQLTLLQAVLMSEELVPDKLDLLKKFIDLGCNVDDYSSTMTAISYAAMSSSFMDYWPLVEYMLNYHEKGHMSDLDIMRVAAKSYDVDMLRKVIKSGKIDVNTTRMRGNHILHILTSDEGYKDQLVDILDIAPEILINPIHRKGYSPLTNAINNLNDSGVLTMLNKRNARIIGEVEKPKMVVDYGITSRYEGDFWNDFPEMINYAVESGRENLLPKTITDIFIF